MIFVYNYVLKDQGTVFVSIADFIFVLERI